MRAEYVEQVESLWAWSKKMRCPKCFNEKFEVVEQLEPKTDLPWYVRCPDCGFEGYESPTRDLAIIRWKQQHYKR